MRKQLLHAVAICAILLGLAVAPATPGWASVASPASNTTEQANCPPDVKCQVVLAGLKDGGCNWSPANRPTDLPVYGVNVHTTEGTLESALAAAQDTNRCVSWNYLIAQDGTVYVSVPKDSLAYTVGNWWVNTHYVQIELVGRAEDCSTLTPDEHRALAKTIRWLSGEFGFRPTPATITGHDSVPAPNDRTMATQHWDPGVCFPWVKLLREVGAPIVPTATPNSPVVTIRTDDSRQPVQDCPGLNPDGTPAFSACVPAAQSTTNFVALYQQPSTTAPLLSDPYLHPDGSAGSTAVQDWGDKAPTGHSYVVLDRKPGWTKIQYGGQAGWFQDNGKVTVPTKARTVTPKGDQPVTIYGRPMPEYEAPGWKDISYDHQTQVPLTKYIMQPGQRYAVAPVPPVRNDYAEGCNLANCTGPGDKTVVIGNEQYIQIWWGHRFAFVKANDVTISPA